MQKHNGPGCCSCGGNGPNDYGNLPNCYCQQIPKTLTMTSFDQNCNYRMFQSCTIQYGPPPPALAGQNLGAEIFCSTQEFLDPIADSYFYYYLSCNQGQFSLTRIYPTSPYGSPYRDGVLYSWLIGGYQNQCVPFHLDSGSAYPGSDRTCRVIIDGPSP